VPLRNILFIFFIALGMHNKSSKEKNKATIHNNKPKIQLCSEWATLFNSTFVVAPSYSISSVGGALGRSIEALYACVRSTIVLGMPYEVKST
jgi:hypothetical protein